MKLRLLLPLVALAAAPSCSLLVDFEDETDLPCPCLPDHVCLVSSNRCVPKNSVEDYKSCSPDAERPDDLCQPGSICYNFRERGPRCLPTCAPSQYSTPEAAERIRTQCVRIGTTCWQIENGGGVCDEGECTDLPDNCGGTRRCVPVNGTGVCFTPCRIFTGDACVGDQQACHPILDSSVTACITSGPREIGQPCSDIDPCMKQDQFGNSIVCDRPANTSDLRRCYRACPFPNMTGCAPGETCQFARNDIDPVTRGALGLCQ